MFLVNIGIHSFFLENYFSHVFLANKGIHSIFLENYFSHMLFVNKRSQTEFSLQEEACSLFYFKQPPCTFLINL